MFKVGDKVICVNDEFATGLLNKGGIYTVKGHSRGFTEIYTEELPHNCWREDRFALVTMGTPDKGWPMNASAQGVLPPGAGSAQGQSQQNVFNNLPPINPYDAHSKAVQNEVNRISAKMLESDYVKEYLGNFIRPKCTCGTSSLHSGGKHSDWCDIKE